MADNFNMKQFLFENKLGAYSKLKTEGEAAYEYEKGKAAGEKEEKEKLTKEDLGQDRTDAEAEKMMDFLYEKEKEEEGYMGTQYGSSEDMAVDMVKKGITEKDKTEEALSLPAAQRMGGLVSQTALKALVNGTQTIIRDLKQDGFESDEIFEYIVSIIKDLE